MANLLQTAAWNTAVDRCTSAMTSGEALNTDGFRDDFGVGEQAGAAWPELASWGAPAVSMMQQALATGGGDPLRRCEIHTQPDFSLDSLTTISEAMLESMAEMVGAGDFETVPQRRKIEGRLSMTVRALEVNARGCGLDYVFVAFPDRGTASLSIREKPAETCGVSQ
ncbi:hypothetical protein ACS3SW_10750 [Roseobacteraceae bacterium S113]